MAKGYMFEIFDMDDDDNFLYGPGPIEANWGPCPTADRETVGDPMANKKRKTLNNRDPQTARKNVPDIEFFGNTDAFRLLCKASSKREGWMKSTKAMQIDGVGCIVQVTTQQGDHIAEAVTFVPGVRIAITGFNLDGTVTDRKLVIL